MTKENLNKTFSSLFEIVFGQPKLPDGCIGETGDSVQYSKVLNILGKDTEASINYSLEGETLAKFVLIAPLVELDLSKLFSLDDVGQALGQLQFHTIKSPALILSYGVSCIDAAQQKLPSIEEGMPLVDGLQIIGQDLADKNEAPLNVWEVQEESGKSPKDQVPQIIRPTLAGYPQHVSIRYGMQPDKVFFDAWWKKVKGTSLEEINQFEFIWEGRSVGVGIADNKKKLPPDLLWIWQANLPTFGGLLLFAQESVFSTSTLVFRPSLPKLLGNGIEAVKFISPDFALEGIVENQQSNVPVYLDYFCYTQGFDFQVGISLGSALQDTEPLLDVYDHIGLRQVSIEIKKTWQPQNQTEYVFSGIIDLYGTNFQVSFSPGKFVSGKIAKDSTIELGQLIENIGGISLPFGLDSLTLSSAEILKDFSEKSLYTLLALSGDIVLIDDILTVQQTSLTIIKEDEGGLHLEMESNAVILELIWLSVKAYYWNSDWKFLMNASAAESCDLEAIVQKIDSSISLPDMLAKFQLTDINVLYETGQGNLDIKGAINWPLPIGTDGEDVELVLVASISKSLSKWRYFFDASISDVAIGRLIQGLAKKMGVGHDEIEGLDALDDLMIQEGALSFEYQPGNDFSFHLEGTVTYPLKDGKDLSIQAGISLAKKQADAEGSGTSRWDAAFTGTVKINEYQFNVELSGTDTGKLLVASLTNDSATINLASLLEEIAPGEIDALIPDDLHLGLQNAFIVFYSPKATGVPPPATKPKATVAFGLEVEIGGKLDLAEVPGIGPLLGKADINLESMRVVGSTADMDAATLKVIDGKLGELSIKGLATEQSGMPAQKPAGPAFRKGAGLSAELHLPGLVVKLAHFFGKKPAQNSQLQTGEGPAGSPPAPASAPAPAAPQKNRMLQPVGQQIGPFFVESIGLAMMGGKFGLKFTGGVTMGPVVLELINFSVVSPFDRFDPRFDLDGIAIGYDKVPLTIAGLLMKVEEIVPEGADEASVTQRSLGFRGGISIGFKQVSITALAAYSQVKIYKPQGHFDHSFHSFFLYGYLGAPLGGPPYLFVTGLALGVGFNRGLNLPKPENFGIFPLTAAALKPSGTALTVKDLKDMMLSLDDYIPIKEGNFWFAAGVKFESFKMLSGFLMLTVEFGDELEIGVLGIVDAIMPVGVPNPTIRISIGFTVRVLPARGVIEVRGSFLPTTFILHKDVKLQGGMALLAIMKDQADGEWAGASAGEFVFTLGGYGPFYHTKPYHPAVPPLQLDWRVSDNLSIWASAYFALTPEAIMLGGHFQGHFGYSKSIVSVSVDFQLGADFIIFWQPLRYLGEASASFHLDGSIHIGKGFFSVDKSLSMDASANMTIWGPDFSGKANLRLHFIVSFSVDVEFGGASKEIKPIDWETFKNSLLPADDKVVSLSLVGGLVQESVQREIPSVNPNKVRLVLDTQVPVKQKNGAEVPAETELGIKPMGLKAENFQSNLTFTTKYMGSEDDFFEFKPIYKNVPAALWQSADVDMVIPGKPQDELIKEVVCGYELMAKKPTLGTGVTIDAATIDDVLVGPVEKQVPPTGADWSVHSAFSEELIHAFYAA